MKSSNVGMSLCQNSLEVPFYRKLQGQPPRVKKVHMASVSEEVELVNHATALPPPCVYALLNKHNIMQTQMWTAEGPACIYQEQVADSIALSFFMG